MNRKIILHIVFILFYSCTLFSQGIAKIKVVDSQGRTDEIIFGNQGSIGIDTSFGEVNLYNTPTDTLEIRTIQRPNMTCFFDYEEYIDLKVDQRPVCATLPMYSNFIFEVSAQDYPVYVIFLEEENLFCGADAFFIKDTVNCQWIEIGYFPSPGDTLFILDGIKPNRFTIYPEVILSSENIIDDRTISIFPNPTTSEIFITNNNTDFKINKISIYNLNGDFISSFVPDQKNSFSYKFLNRGIYLVVAEIEDNLITKKIVVE